MEKIKIRISAEINANIDKVWENWTNPIHVTQWNHASDDWHSPYAENDLRIGGKFVYRMAAKDESFAFDFEGIYDDVEHHKLISYTMPDSRKVENTFSQKDNQVELVTVFEAETMNSPELQEQGWQMILNNFKKYCESN